MSGSTSPSCDHPVEWLKTIYLKRKWQNPRYSMRAFARSLDMNSGRLSEILALKRTLTVDMGTRIAGRLNLSDGEANQFLGLIKHQRRKLRELRTIDRETSGRFLYNTLSLDQFKLIADWQHYAILALMKTANFRSDIDWIATRLTLTNKIVKQAVNRLIRLGLVKVDQEAFHAVDAKLSTPRDIPSEAIRRAHKQYINNAAKALVTADVELRDFSSITMAIDPRNLGRAKEYIHEFRRRLATILEDGEQTEVYTLNIQLFPVTGEGS